MSGRERSSTKRISACVAGCRQPFLSDSENLPQEIFKTFAFGMIEEFVGRALFDEIAAVQEHDAAGDLAGKAPDLASKALAENTVSRGKYCEQKGKDDPAPSYLLRFFQMYAPKYAFSD